MTRRIHRSALVALIVTTVAVSSLSALPAAAAEGQPVIVDIPFEKRSHPRNTAILGETAEGIYLLSESDPVGSQSRGDYVALLIEPNGTAVPSDTGYGEVFGSRIVSRPGSFPDSLSWRTSAHGPLSTTPIPEGTGYFAHTADGVVVHTSTGMGIVGWEGEAIRSLELPSGYELSSLIDSDAHGFLSFAHKTGSEIIVYVDTASETSYTLPPSTTRSARLGVDTIAWFATVGSSTVIQTIARPDGEVSPVHNRAAPVFADGSIELSRLSLLPVGDDVVVFRDELDFVQWGSEVAAPVIASHADGSSTQLLGWGHDVRSGVGGSVLAVGGADPAHQAVVRLAPESLVPTTVIQRPAPRARSLSVTIDDSSLFVGDESLAYGAVNEYAIDSPNGVTASGAYPGSKPMSGDATVSWAAPTAPRLVVRDSDGTTRHLNAGGLAFRQISTRWALVGERQLTDLATGATTYLPQENTALDNDVLYIPGETWLTARNTVIARDLNTGASAFLAAPSGCANVSKVQVAGSWMLVDCATSVPVVDNIQIVVDRTGANDPLTLAESAGTVILGNGFIVEQVGAELKWSSITDGVIDLQPLTDDAATVSVSRGTTPTLAWIDSNAQTHAATLPNTTSAPPAAPTGVAVAPTAPVVSAVAGSSSVALTWPAVDPDEMLSGFIVTRSGGGTGRSVVLPANATGHTFTGLTSGMTFSFTVQAQNARGTSVRPAVTATPMVPTPEYSRLVSASFVESTEMLTVTWAYTRAIGHDPVTSFDVTFGDHSVTGLSAATRTVTFSTPGALRGQLVTLTARGARGSIDDQLAIESDDDSEAPAAAVTGLSPVTLSKTIAATIEATDNVGVEHFDVRLRASTGPSTAIGAWTYPTAWQGITSTRDVTRAATPGRTYCLSTRATDAQHNASEWSPELCTAVALDDKNLKKVGSWKTYVSSRYFNGSSVRVQSNSSYLATKARSSAVYIVATTCPTCGTIGVKYGKYSTWGVSLRSSETKYRQVIKVMGPDTFTGEVKVVRWNSKDASVDGLAVMGR